MHQRAYIIRFYFDAIIPSDPPWRTTVAHDGWLLEASMTSFFVSARFIVSCPSLRLRGSRPRRPPLTRSLPIARPSPITHLPSPHQPISTCQTEPVRYWHMVFLLACPNRTVPLQIMAESLTQPSTIVLTDDARWNRRPKANSISPRVKRMPS